MAQTQVNTNQVRASAIERSDLNTGTTGQAVIAKVVQGTLIAITSTGVDSGTGDVTVNIGALSAAGMLIGSPSTSTTPQALSVGAGTGLFINGTTLYGNLFDSDSAGGQAFTTVNEIYLSQSLVTVPAGAIAVNSVYHCLIQITKTAAGTLSGPLTFRCGTLGTTGDTGFAVMAQQTGTAAADTGLIDVFVLFGAPSASSTVRSLTNLVHNGTSTGLWNTGTLQFIVGSLSSSGATTFNTTTATKLGLSYNAGAASVSHTLTVLKAEFIRP